MRLWLVLEPCCGCQGQRLVSEVGPVGLVSQSTLHDFSVYWPICVIWPICFNLFFWCSLFFHIFPMFQLVYLSSIAGICRFELMGSWAVTLNWLLCWWVRILVEARTGCPLKIDAAWACHNVTQRHKQQTSKNKISNYINLRIISGSVMVSSSHVPRVCRLQASYAMQVIGLHLATSSSPSSHTLQKQRSSCNGIPWNSIVMMCDVFLPRRQGWSHSKGSWQGWIAGIIAGICLESAEQVLGSVCLPLKWLCICNYSTGAIIFDMWCLMMSRFLQLSGRVVNRRFETRNMVSTQRISAPRHRNSKMTWYQKDPAMAQFLVMKWAVFGQTLHWISRHRLIISNHHGCHLTHWRSQRGKCQPLCVFSWLSGHWIIFA